MVVASYRKDVDFVLVYRLGSLYFWNLELLGEVGGGRPLQLCCWTYLAKSKSKQVIAKKRPKFNNKPTLVLASEFFFHPNFFYFVRFFRGGWG